MTPFFSIYIGICEGLALQIDFIDNQLVQTNVQSSLTAWLFSPTEEIGLNITSCDLNILKILLTKLHKFFCALKNNMVKVPRLNH